MLPKQSSLYLRHPAALVAIHQPAFSLYDRLAALSEAWGWYHLLPKTGAGWRQGQPESWVQGDEKTLNPQIL